MYCGGLHQGGVVHLPLHVGALLSESVVEHVESMWHVSDVLAHIWLDAYLGLTYTWCVEQP